MEKLSMDALQRPSSATARAAAKLPLVLVLDNIRSGLNVGSIFRSADAFLAEELVLCGITAQPPHREILKTALGSTETVPWRYESDVVQALQGLRATGYRVLAVEQASPRTWLHEVAPTPGERYALLLGNEVDGVSPAALAHCDGAIEIPQFGAKHSLNVAVAAGIVLWEFARKMKL
jgi:tRNA G18 (ribose-2'-O)-methylase SpoU